MNMNAAVSPFKQIAPIPPAHAMTVNRDGVRVTRYWSMPIEEPLRYRRSRDYLDQYLCLLGTAVEDRLRTDRVSATLSGGLDSSTVTAVAVEKLGSPELLLGLTFGYNRAIPDPEPGLAASIGEFLRIPHRYFAIEDSKPFDQKNLQKIRISWPYPLFMVAAYCNLYRAAAGHARILLTGEGGDVGFVPSLQVHTGLRFLPLMWNVARFMMSRGRHPRIGFQLAYERWRGFPSGPVAGYPEWLNPIFESSAGLKERWIELNRDPVSKHPFRPDSYSSLIQEQWSYLFELCDAGSTHIPLELRHPLFDLRLQRFLLRLPILPWTADKELVRLGMRGRLPREVLRRPKSPVLGDPLSQMMRETDPAGLNDFASGPGFERYIAREKIPVLGGQAQVKDPGLHLRALDLNFWLLSLT